MCLHFLALYDGWFLTDSSSQESCHIVCDYTYRWPTSRWTLDGPLPERLTLDGPLQIDFCLRDGRGDGLVVTEGGVTKDASE